MRETNHNIHAYSVSEISAGVKRVVEDNFGFVRVRGEVGKVGVNSASGHCYLSLKDEKALLDAVCWKGTYNKLAHKPEMGMEVIASGKLTTYPGSSKYQLVIEALEPAGEGALMALLEKRKKALAAEGLFATARKKPLPFLPRVIGVVTSPTGAVIRDILHRLSDRMPAHVLVWPVRVQGEGAAEEIARAIGGFNALPEAEHIFGGRPAAPHPPRFAAVQSHLNTVFRPDVIIVARGGGSIEDLWCFNEEVVVRAAAASTIPLISAVGHETDTTLIDFAADVRAPTPTAAAEMAVPVRAELMAQLASDGARVQQAMVRLLQHRSERVETLAHALPKPQAVLAVATQRLDDWAERLQHALPRLVERKQQILLGASAALKPDMLRPLLQQKTHALALAHERMGERVQGLLRNKTQALELMGRMLEAMDVRAVMARGFALVRSVGENGADDTVITRAAGAQAVMQIAWVDGVVQVVKEDSALSIQHAGKEKKGKKTTKKAIEQDSLF